MFLIHFSWIVYRCQILDSSSTRTTITPTRHSGQDSKGSTDDWGVGDIGDSWGAEGADDWGDEANNWGMEGADDWGTEGNEECREEEIVEDLSSGIEVSKGTEDKCDGNIQDNCVDYKDSGPCQVMHESGGLTMYDGESSMVMTQFSKHTLLIEVVSQECIKSSGT